MCLIDIPFSIIMIFIDKQHYQLFSLILNYLPTNYFTNISHLLNDCVNLTKKY